jgi:hypothetical protein
VEHLVNYMTTRHELSAVTDLLVALGRFHESGIVAYRQAIAVPSTEYRIRYVRKPVMGAGRFLCLFWSGLSKARLRSTFQLRTFLLVLRIRIFVRIRHSDPDLELLFEKLRWFIK